MCLVPQKNTIIACNIRNSTLSTLYIPAAFQYPETMPLPRSVRQPFAGAFSKYEIQHLRRLSRGSADPREYSRSWWLAQSCPAHAASPWIPVFFASGVRKKSNYLVQFNLLPQLTVIILRPPVQWPENLTIIQHITGRKQCRILRILCRQNLSQLFIRRSIMIILKTDLWNIHPKQIIQELFRIFRILTILCDCPGIYPNVGSFFRSCWWYVDGVRP